MKKIFSLIIVALLLGVTNASAQGFLSKLFGGGNSSETENTISNVLGSLIGNSVTLSEKMLEGTWNYTGTACVLESDAALANIGGTVATAKIEKKLDGYLARVGVKEGTCSFTFIGKDSCVVSMAGRELGGRYALDAEEKTIQFTFYGRLNFNTHIAYNVSSVNIVFNADKLLSLVKTVTSKVSSSAGSLSQNDATGNLGTASATLSTISSLLSNYDGMILGVKMKK